MAVSGSHSAASGPLLLKPLLQSPIFEALFDVLALVAELERQLMHVVLLVHVVSKSVVLRHSSARLTVLSLGVVITHTVLSLSRLHTNVLVHELLRGELVHEVLAGDEATLLVGILEDDLVEPLDYGLHNLVEAEVERLLIFAVGSDVLPELLVDFLDDSLEPLADVCIRQLHLLVHFDSLVVELLGCLDLDVELVDFRVG